MPSLHDLTIRIKTRFSPSSLASTSPSTSPTSLPSFEVITGKRIYNGDGICKTPTQKVELKVLGKEKEVKHRHRRMDSFLDEIDGVSVPAQIVLRARIVSAEEDLSKGAKRRSRFREEFEHEQYADVKL
jgi:hypothetical protein